MQVDPNPDLERLRQYVTGMHDLTAPEWAGLRTGWQIITVKRKTMLTAAGETERYLYFVLEGVQRAFYLGTRNQDATLVFTYPPSFSGVADSFLTRQPSNYFFETLTASRMMRMPYETVFQLMEQHPGIRTFVLNVTAQALRGVLQRQVEIQCLNAEEKFKTLLRRSPHLLQLIPHKYIASYLALDATTFSKLLGSIKIQ